MVQTLRYRMDQTTKPLTKDTSGTTITGPIQLFSAWATPILSRFGDSRKPLFVPGGLGWVAGREKSVSKLVNIYKN